MMSFDSIKPPPTSPSQPAAWHEKYKISSSMSMQCHVDTIINKVRFSLFTSHLISTLDSDTYRLLLRLLMSVHMIHIINIFMKWSRSSAKLWEDLLFHQRVCRRRWQTPLWFVYHISDIRHQLAWLLFFIHCQITSKKEIEKPPHAIVQQVSVEDVNFFPRDVWWCAVVERFMEKHVDDVESERTRGAESSSMWMSRRHRSQTASSSRARGCGEKYAHSLFLRLLWAE